MIYHVDTDLPAFYLTSYLIINIYKFVKVLAVNKF